MPWFRVDDNLGFHHKVIAAGNPAMGLWVRAGSVSASQLTDGFVADHMVTSLGTVAQAKRLVDVGLWSRVKGGYTFHEWEERQPRRVDVEAERAAAKERMRAARERKRRAAQDTPTQVSNPRSEDVRANTSRSSGEVRDVFGDPDPSLPDPSLPDPPKDSSVADAPSQKKSPSRATRRPDDFRPSQAHIDLAGERGVDLREEWSKFCDWCDANGKTYKDWPAALRNWIRNARPTRQAAGDQPSNVQQHLALARRLAEEEQAQTIPFPQIGERR